MIQFKVSVTLPVHDLAQFITNYPKAEIEIIQNGKAPAKAKTFTKSSTPKSHLTLGNSKTALPKSGLIAKQAAIKFLAGKKSDTRGNLTAAIGEALTQAGFNSSSASSSISLLIQTGHLVVEK